MDKDTKQHAIREAIVISLYMYRIMDSLASGTLPRYLRINDDKNAPITGTVTEIITELIVTLTMNESFGFVIRSLCIIDDEVFTSYWLTIDMLPE